MRLAPVIATTDPLPAEMLAAADTLAHQAGSMMMQASALSLLMRRSDASLDAIVKGIDAIADEHRATARSVTIIADRIAALEAAGR